MEAFTTAFDANFAAVIASSAISSVSTAPSPIIEFTTFAAPIVTAPVFAIVTSPDNGTSAATFEPLPTNTLVEASAANFECAIAAFEAIEAFTTAFEANFAAVTASSLSWLFQRHLLQFLQCQQHYLLAWH